MAPNRRPLTSRDYRWVQALAGWLARRGVSPNGISVAGMVFATFGVVLCLVVAHERPLVGLPQKNVFVECSLPDPLPIIWMVLCFIGTAIAIQLRLMCNLLDGLVAVEGGRKGKAGSLFNEAPDRYADVALLAAAGFAISVSWLGWMAAAFAVSTAYARAFGASLGLGQDFSGPMAKQQRMFFLTAGTLGEAITTVLCRPTAPFRVWPSSLLESPLYWTLWLIALGSAFTFARRIVRIYRKLP